MSWKLVSIEKVSSKGRADLKAIMETYKELVRSKRVKRALPVNFTTGELISGAELYEALRLLSVKRVPITEHDEEVEVDLPLEELGKEEVFGSEARIFNDTLELLYRNWPTPMVKLSSLSDVEREVWAKLEAYNPFSNSVKDRIGWSMMLEAVENGCASDLFYEATSTNTGIALTSIGNMLKKVCRLYIPKSIQKVSDVFLKALGAEVVRMEVSLTIEAVDRVGEEAKRENAVMLNQFENDSNFKVHLKHTAREIEAQLGSLGKVPDYIIGGIGTSGHMSAISFYFKTRYGDRVKVIGVQPAKDHVIPGIRRVETGMKWIHMVEFDEIVDIERDEAIEGVLHVARNDGILIGLSSGAVASAIKKLKLKGVVAAVFPDSGYKYAEQLEEYMKKRET